MYMNMYMYMYMYITVKQHFYACDKIMRICQDGLLDKFICVCIDAIKNYVVYRYNFLQSVNDSHNFT